MNITYQDMPAHEMFTDTGNIGIQYAPGVSFGPNKSMNSIQKNPAVQFLDEWYEILTDRFRPSSGFHADPIDGSLIGPDEGLGNASCTQAYGHTCCTAENPCDLGEGDCDKDYDCVGDLRCGDRNCHPSLELRDCCYLPGG